MLIQTELLSDKLSQTDRDILYRADKGLKEWEAMKTKLKQIASLGSSSSNDAIISKINEILNSLKSL